MDPRRLSVLPLLLLAACSSTRVTLLPPPPRSAPVEERQRYATALDPDPATIAPSGSAAMTLNYANGVSLFTKSGVRISDPRDLLQVMPASSRVAGYVRAYEERQTVANVLIGSSVGLVALSGVPFGVGLAQLMNDPKREAGGGWLTLGLGVLLGSLVPLLVSVGFSGDAQVEKASAFFALPRELRALLGLPEEARP